MLGVVLAIGFYRQAKFANEVCLNFCLPGCSLAYTQTAGCTPADRSIRNGAASSWRGLQRETYAHVFPRTANLQLTRAMQCVSTVMRSHTALLEPNSWNFV
jgi:hypothetical protein